MLVAFVQQWARMMNVLFPTAVEASDLCEAFSDFDGSFAFVLIQAYSIFGAWSAIVGYIM